jgi:hypothetical protein
MTKEVPVTEGGSSDEQAKKLIDELHKVTDQKDAYAQRCHDLDLQV